MILLVDHADSFTYNLAQMIEELGHECDVRRSDALTLEEVRAMRPSAIVLSPGPGAPEATGVTLEILRELGHEIPILGVCLGHQALGHVFGGHVVRAPKPVHGKLTDITHDGRGLFRHLANPFHAVRYHSLVVEESSLPDCLEVSARNEDGLVMGLRHREFPVEGVQFHPESIATEGGRQILANFLSSVRRVS